MAAAREDPLAFNNWAKEQAKEQVVPKAREKSGKAAVWFATEAHHFGQSAGADGEVRPCRRCAQDFYFDAGWKKICWTCYQKEHP